MEPSSANTRSTDGRRAAPRPLLETAAVVAAWLLGLAGAIGQWVLQARAAPGGALQEVLEPADLTSPVVTIVMATAGAVVVLRSDSRRYGWIMLGAGSAVGLVGFSAHYSVFGLDTGVPFVSAATWIQDLWMIAQFAVFLLVALFPDGSAASKRWRAPVRMVSIGWASLMAVFAFTERPATNFFLDLEGLVAIPPNATGVLPIPDAVIGVWWVVLVMASAVVGLGSLYARWRRADVESRQRMKWVLYAFGVFLGFLALDVAYQALLEIGVADLDLRTPMNLALAAVQVGLVIALGLGIFRYRLHDVDLFINRTIVYGILTALVVATYIGVVVGVGAVLPIEQTVLALIVTGVVAVAFAPLRSVVQGWVNRLMFGQRDDPYAVLAKLGRLLARSGEPEAALGNLVDTIAVSLKLPGVAIELEEDGRWRRWASYGDVDAVDRDATMIPLRHRGEAVGRLLAAPRSPRDPLSVKDVVLLEDIAHQAGALARSVHLTRALQRSREQLVLAQEEERRRIRHDLHDELGPSLASQTFALDAALERIDIDPESARTLLVALKEQNKQLVADIRRLVYALRPPALDELGVVGALAAQASQLARSDQVRIDLETRPDPLPKLPAAVEVAAYRIAREAIINTLRHAEARRCTTTLEATGTELVVTVSDDGIGIDAMSQPGVGLTSMRERTEELGGVFQLAPNGSSGTRVRAAIPLAHPMRERTTPGG